MPGLTYISDATATGNSSTILDVAAQGSEESAMVGETINLLLMEQYMPKSETRWIDIFTRNNGTFAYDVTPKDLSRYVLARHGPL
ncbi:hypothetical protein N8T08_009812 [Aspergillus melleus]|uniref:Uncharacterized protein n=1 Tax=Aspergillus melleus TaxID=138277 RepID=A0ACC3ASM9_9EURO|nr:hypothetical protein N8T08_009812 [Aspergillus melleus]